MLNMGMDTDMNTDTDTEAWSGSQLDLGEFH
jgi:hypothetical protein